MINGIILSDYESKLIYNLIKGLSYSDITKYTDKSISDTYLAIDTLLNQIYNQMEEIRYDK